ncbi:hypothetical protein HTZ77_07155 [Nonomuraea sp. SMC257]|uniref:Uncharacterized protein n=1 Tax=Nonomuraea montanisoli TaxID=2741721 RepID=A0A7Y6I3U7_9ACTN|nr:hypothetical protein [Nonomuraea montanisoli]NUW31198.1 hypothetical protein [Nonomuraea montanisoli]
MLAPEGPMVIDWADAAEGVPALLDEAVALVRSMLGVQGRRREPRDQPPNLS